MRRAAVLLVGALAVAAGQAEAALPAAPGVALVGVSVTTTGPYTPSSRAAYDGTAGPLTGNKVTVTVNGDGTVSFAAPLTAMVPLPPVFHTDQGLGCSAGLAHSICTFPSRAGGYYICYSAVAGNIGADVVVVRNGFAGSPTCPNNVYSSVATGRGNDLVDVRDGRQSVVVCGPGFDRVYADVGDQVYPDCEAQAFS